MTPIEPEQAIEYATPTVGRSHWPAAIFCLTGLGLVVTGGCFLVGVLLLTSSPMTQSLRSLPLRQLILLIVLYTMAGVCFLAAVWMIVQGVKRLMR